MKPTKRCPNLPTHAAHKIWQEAQQHTLKANISTSIERVSGQAEAETEGETERQRISTILSIFSGFNLFCYCTIIRKRGHSRARHTSIYISVCVFVRCTNIIYIQIDMYGYIVFIYLATFTTACFFIYFSLQRFSQLLIDTNNIGVCMLNVLPASARSSDGASCVVGAQKCDSSMIVYLHSRESRTTYIHTEINSVFFLSVVHKEAKNTENARSTQIAIE